MESDFRKKQKAMMDEYRKKNFSFDEVFREAPYRQLILVSTCFDICIETFADNYESLGLTVEDLKSRRILGIDGIGSEKFIAAKSFYRDVEDVKSLMPTEMKKIRKNLTEFLEQECGVIVIIDGDVKSKERSLEKAGNHKDGSILNLNDVNRLTIASSNGSLLDCFADKLSARYPSSEICAKETWEMKPFGLLSKSNYILIDGFPAEIHLNDPKQIMLSKVMTHLVYEAMRVNTISEDEEATFNRLYSELPKKIQESISKNQSSIQERDLQILNSLNTELSHNIEIGHDLPIFKKQDQLLEFHRKAHKVFFDNGSPEWKNIYLQAEKEYNNKKRQSADLSQQGSSLDNKRFKI